MNKTIGCIIRYGLSVEVKSKRKVFILVLDYAEMLGEKRFDTDVHYNEPGILPYITEVETRSYDMNFNKI